MLSEQKKRKVCRAMLRHTFCYVSGYGSGNRGCEGTKTEKILFFFAKFISCNRIIIINHYKRIAYRRILLLKLS